MAHLSEQAEGGHIDEQSYRVLANTLQDIYNSLKTSEAAQAQRAHLPVRPPPSLALNTQTLAALQQSGVTAQDLDRIAAGANSPPSTLTQLLQRFQQDQERRE